MYELPPVNAHIDDIVSERSDRWNPKVEFHRGTSTLLHHQNVRDKKDHYSLMLKLIEATEQLPGLARVKCFAVGVSSP
jgi:hypothetical protein